MGVIAITNLTVTEWGNEKTILPKLPNSTLRLAASVLRCANVFFLSGSYLLHKTKKRRISINKR